MHADSTYALQARAGQTKTLVEFQQLITALQKDKKLLQAQVAHHKPIAEQREQLRQQAEAARDALKVTKSGVISEGDTRAFPAS
jgi:hypothetical protein